MVNLSKPSARRHKTLVMRYLPENRHYQLVGCDDITIEPYRA
jgi:hypothetical protein